MRRRIGSQLREWSNVIMWLCRPIVVYMITRARLFCISSWGSSWTNLGGYRGICRNQGRWTLGILSEWWRSFSLCKQVSDLTLNKIKVRYLWNFGNKFAKGKITFKNKSKIAYWVSWCIFAWLEPHRNMNCWRNPIIS